MADEPTLAQLQKQKRDLERELAYARLRIEALETLIDLAEKDGISIRKNVGAKQSRPSGPVTRGSVSR